MQLSLSSAPSPASTESADLLNSPAGASTDESSTGFDDLMADLQPEAEAPTETGEAVPSVAPGATDAAASQVVVDLMAWMVRTPPPPPAPIPTSELPEGEIDLAGEGTALADPLMGQGGDPASLPLTAPSAAGENLIRWGARDTFAPVLARTGIPSAAAPTSGSVTTPAEGETAAAPLLASAPLRTPEQVVAATTAAGSAEVAASGAAAAEPALAPLAPGAFRLRAEARGEKIAAGGRALSVPTDSANFSSEKNFLNVDKESDTKEVTPIGISVAKSDANMPVLSTPSSLSSARTDSGAIAAVMETAGSAGESPTMPAPMETPEAIAHTAVAAVTKAVERAEAAPRTAVNLQFSIGDSDLVVRIEHRADEVRATFRTDSGELRAALSTEWQSAVSGGADHALRRVEPVFTSASNTDDQHQRGSSEGNAAGSQQRQAGRESAGEPTTPFAAFMRRPATAAASVASDPVAASAVRPGLLPTALHLQTFA